ncbi:MAG: FAD:protein FMN transferase [Arcobacter sp.]|nr:FAD:protein FMN transferase [Arcobacter sp.]
MLIASSGGYGTRFNKNLHHLFNPHEAQSANFVNAVTILAPTATLADALSTAVYVMPKEKSKKLLSLYPEVKGYIS